MTPTPSTVEPLNEDPIALLGKQIERLQTHAPYMNLSDVARLNRTDLMIFIGMLSNLQTTAEHAIRAATAMDMRKPSQAPLREG